MILCDHCRIGSLENYPRLSLHNKDDHCRIGSLENPIDRLGLVGGRSLPHRQLRNV